jgi:hypothetical protein
VSTTAIKTASAPSGTGGAAGSGGPLVLAGTQGGVTLIPQPTALTRLNYFDGKFLRADDLRVEQDYLRNLVWLSNRAGGSGVVSGLDVSDGGAGKLELSAGLAIDPRGRVLSMPYDTTVEVAKLIEASRQAAAAKAAGAGGTPGFAACAPDTVTTTPPAGGAVTEDLYLVVAYHAEAMCGEQDVYGKLCEDACVTSTARPYRLEGIVLRAVPLALGPAACTATWLGRKHRRNQLASAFFADERATLGREMSGARLRTEVWCRGAAAETGDGVPLAVVSLSGGALEFVDEWTARRERMADPPVRWWQWQTGMRPLAVFWAQVLQFQCQLADVLSVGVDTPATDDPCAPAMKLLEEARTLLGNLDRRMAAARRLPGGAAVDSDNVIDRYRRQPGGAELFEPEYLARVRGLHGTVTAQLAAKEAAPTRILIDRGIVELPPAGYLPVEVGQVDVNTQVRRLMGEGVDLRFCVVRPDYVGHAFEEGQHLDRICLLQGLENPAAKPAVDIFVPDGRILDKPVAPAGRSFEVEITLGGEAIDFGGGDEETVEIQPPTDKLPTLDKYDRGTMYRSRTMSTSDTGETDEGLTLRGAGRSEPLPGGGAAFHFAGLGRGTLPDLDGGTPDGSSLRERSFDATGAASSTYTRETSFGFSGRRVDPLQMLVSTLRPRKERGGVYGMQSTEQPQVIVVTPPVNQTPDPPPAIWSSMACDRDPFALRPGDSTGVRMEMYATVTDEGEVKAGSATITGQLACYEGGAGTASMKGRLRHTWMHVHTVGEGAEPVDPIPLKWAVELTAAVLPGGARSVVAKVEIFPGLVLTVTTTYGAAPILARSRVTGDMLAWLRELLERQDNPTAAAEEWLEKLEDEHPELAEVQLAAAVARENADVLRPANTYHGQAVQALRRIEAAVREPGFRVDGERKLFPPAPPLPSVPSVAATRDWVLFRRRRASSCDCCPPAAAVATERRYRLYTVAVDDDDITPGEVRDRLDDPNPGELVVVGVVPRFEGGSTELSTTSAEILEAWKEANPGTAIFYGMVSGAGEGAGDDDAVLSSRLDRVVSAVGTATPTLPKAEFDVISPVPAALSAEGVDGVMLLLTHEPAEQPPAVQTSHEVFYVRSFETQAQLLTAVQNLASTPALLIQRLEAQSLGTVTFEEGDDTPIDGLAEVETAWNALTAGGVSPSGIRAAVVASMDVNDATRARVAQAQAVTVSLEGGTITPAAVQLAGPPASSSPAVLLLLPQFQDPATGAGKP